MAFDAPQQQNRSAPIQGQIDTLFASLSTLWGKHVATANDVSKLMAQWGTKFGTTKILTLIGTGGGGGGGTTTSGSRAFTIPSFYADEIVEIGLGLIGFVVPADFDGYSVKSAISEVVLQGGGSSPTSINIRRRRNGAEVDVLSTPISILSGYYASNGTINTSNSGLSTGDILFSDITTVQNPAPTGLFTTITIG